jgi:hypothetical protein
MENEITKRISTDIFWVFKVCVDLLQYLTPSLSGIWTHNVSGDHTFIVKIEINI